MTFANEVRDFIAGYTAVREVGQRDRDADRSDRELDMRETRNNHDMEYQNAMLELRREEVRGRLARGAAGGGGRGGGAGRNERGETPSQERARIRFERQTAEWNERQRAAEMETVHNRLLASQGPPGLSFGAPPSTPAAAIPAGDPDDDAQAASDDDDFDPWRRHFNQGGLVEDDLPEEDPDLPYINPPRPTAPTAAPTVGAIPAQAQPEAPAAPQTGTPEEPAAPEEPPVSPEASRVVSERAAQAVDAAARSISAETQTPQGAVGPGSEASGTDIIRNVGGLSQEEYSAAYQAIDREGRIPAHMQGTAMMAEGYQYYIDRGQPERAVVFARQIMISLKEASQTFGAMALEAIEQGDIESACRFFNDACNRFPSGHEIRVDQDPRTGVLTYVVNNNGEEIERGNMDVGQFFEYTTGIANGSAFLQQVVQFGANHSGPNASLTPERSVEAAIDARLSAQTAVDAVTEARQNGVTGEELRQLVEAATAATAADRQARAEAIRLGVRRTDVDAALNQASRVAVPSVPESEMAIPEERPGMFAGLRNWWNGDSGEEPEAVPTGRTPPATTSGASVTPPGNAPAAPPQITTQQQYDALPSGTRFTAPDGTVRVKP